MQNCEKCPEKCACIILGETACKDNDENMPCCSSLLCLPVSEAVGGVPRLRFFLFCIFTPELQVGLLGLPC